jgi:hypothetical protein
MFPVPPPPFPAEVLSKWLMVNTALAVGAPLAEAEGIATYSLWGHEYEIPDLENAMRIRREIVDQVRGAGHE